MAEIVIKVSDTAAGARIEVNCSRPLPGNVYDMTPAQKCAHAVSGFLAGKVPLEYVSGVMDINLCPENNERYKKWLR